MNIPLLSVCCLTYNHESFIRDCLEGILMQKTNFLFEIVIHDDASTDNTQNIISEYLAKNQNIFVPVFQIENQYSKGRNPGVEFMLPKARGKYIALIEGDDYWTDPYKLQKQFDFMEANPDYNMCGHYASRLINGEFIPPVPMETRDFNFDDIASRRIVFATLSMFFRNNIEFPDWLNKVYGGDRALVFLNAKKGKLRKIGFNGGVYRVHAGGIEQRFKKDKFSLPIRNINEYIIYYSVIEDMKYKNQIKYQVQKNYYYLILWSFLYFKFNLLFKSIVNLIYLKFNKLKSI